MSAVTTTQLQINGRQWIDCDGKPLSNNSASKKYFLLLYKESSMIVTIEHFLLQTCNMERSRTKV